MYAKCFKRLMDFTLSLCALLVLWPILLILAVIGTVKMKGNPFFTQQRPGKDGKIFNLIKFRSMTCEKDAQGNLLPDDQRMTHYGQVLRSTSLDELPELINILIGDMSIVGPRPLLVKYLPLYNAEQRRRHEVRPGLTGLAQINGRNNLTWEQKFAYDLEYVNDLTFAADVRIVFGTVAKVLKRADIAVGSEYTGGKFLDQRRALAEEKDYAVRSK